MSELRNTSLWHIMETKATKEGLPPGFATAVEKVCQEGIIKAKTIICFFPNFTLHDETHIMNVCEWMTRLLGNRANELTACDAAMLLMAACCHDIGMSVSQGQEKELKKAVKKERKSTTEPTGEQLREYVRQHHHERIAKEFTLARWQELDGDRALQNQGILHKHLVAICKSHGEPIESFKMNGDFTYDPRLCAVLLRLADILDFDATRAPQTLFDHIGLASAEDLERVFSKAEWMKNRAGQFSITEKNQIRYTASYDDPNIEHKVTDYLKWVEKELYECAGFLASFDGRWKDLRFPYKIYANEDTLQRCGYKGGDFLITMSQERIIDLLAGENLYGDSCVFVRELLQNAIDAILWRSKKDSDFDVSDGKINITVWHDETGQGWFRIEDNGTGMDENILQNYFLKVGCSYYDSDDFREEDRTYSPQNSYKPISRFGIGILSCFMSDKRNTLEVSTKRYTHDVNQENPGIRLSVTGRNGYYSLAVEDEEDESPWQEMPDPDKDTHETYRTEPGTTICVGMNLFRLGDYRNIKEVVDKYVCFPDMQVTYRGPEGETTYPTKSNFLGAVEQLKAAHGDTFPIVCRHPIPDETFEKIKEWLPDSEWDAKPEIMLSYFPLDLFHTGNLCGMAVYPDVDWHVKQIRFLFQNVNYILTIKSGFRGMFFENATALQLSVSVDFPEEVDYKMRTLPPSVLLKRKNQKAVKDYERCRRERTLIIPLPQLLSASEKDIIRYVDPDDDLGSIAYNGVVVGRRHDFRTGVLLLGGSYAPEVNVARNTVRLLPIEAAFELACLERRINRFLTGMYNQNYQHQSWGSYLSFLFMTERELSVLLDAHPTWGTELLDLFFDPQLADLLRRKVHQDNLTIDSPQKSFLGYMLLAWLKRDYRIAYGGNEKIVLSEKTAACTDTAGFPASLFVDSFEHKELLGVINFLHFNYFSSRHPFSQWLIQHRAELQEELPDVYHKLLVWMMEGESISKIVNGINEQLKLLRHYCYNRFHVSEELFLQESDLLYYAGSYRVVG